MKKSLYITVHVKAFILFILVMPFLFLPPAAAHIISLAHPDHAVLQTTKNKVADDFPSIEITLSPASLDYQPAEFSAYNAISGSPLATAPAAPPTITCPGNIKADADQGICSARVNGLAAILNDPDNDITSLSWTMSGVTVESSPLTGINNLVDFVFNTGITTITYTVTDAGNNTVSCSFTVTVYDKQPPSIDCPADITITIPACFTIPTTIALIPPTVNDNCGTPILLNNAPAQFPLGETSVIWNAKDINGLTSYSCNQIVTIKQAPAISISLNSIPVSCFGANNGSVTATVSNGTPPYTYTWNSSPVQNTPTATNLSPGTYSIIVTDKDGCSVTSANVTITAPASALSASILTRQNVNCYGNSTGSFTVATSGGTPAYEYSLDGVTFQGNSTFSGLAAGAYVVTVRDSRSCTTTTESVNITQPAAVLAASIASPVNVLCFGQANGSATVTATGGTTPYGYAWNTVPPQTSPTASNLTAGTWSVIVTDAHGCSAPAEVIITQPTALSANIPAQLNVACFGNSTGSVTVEGSGGTPAYQYSLNGGTFQPSGLFSGLSAGTYTVKVMDGNNCAFDKTDIIITQPVEALAAVAAQVNILCFGQANGSATVTASGGTAPYLFSWSTLPPRTTATITDLAPGPYTVTVTDAAGCIKTANVTITQPLAPLSGTISGQANVHCFGLATGSVTIASSGGTTPYQYSLNGGTYQYIGTFSNLAAASYTVNVRDANNCNVDVSIIITQPALGLSATIDSHTNVACFGQTNGTATVTVAGGIDPYTYVWNTIPVQTTATAVNLPPGDYTVTVTDANSCTATASVTITQPEVLAAIINTPVNVLCFGKADGNATVTVTGGAQPYTYTWTTIPAQTAVTAVNLAGGLYTVMVTDAGGCTATADVTITEPASALLASITNQQEVLCFGNASGSVTVAGNGGITPYQYSLNGGTSQDDGTFLNLAAASYTVSVRDANNCTVDVDVIITQPVTGLSATIDSHTNVACSGQSSGSATVTAVGGIEPYTYVWNTIPVQTSATAENLPTGDYTVTVTDAKSCTASATVTITQPELLAAIINTPVNVLCFGKADGSATVTVTGGVQPYTYAWTTIPAQTEVTAVNLAGGLYTVMVTDAGGCTATADVTITEPASALTASITSQQEVLCFGNTSGSVTVAGNGGITPYQYSLNGGTYQDDGTFPNLAAASYTVSVRDANNCTFDVPVTIIQPVSELSATIGSQTNVACFGQSNGSATVTVTGGTSPCLYAWDAIPAQTTATVTDLAPGNYTVTVTDANICTATATVTITQPEALLATITNQVSEDCAGNANGSVTLEGSGGTPAYQFNLNGGVYQPEGFFGNLVTGSYTVTLKDANNCTFDVACTIALLGQPQANEDLSSTLEDTPVSGNVMANDRGFCFPPVTVTSNTTPANGSVVMLPDGSFTYTPLPNYNGTDFFSYTLTDIIGNSSTAQATITITAVNDPPVAMDDKDTTTFNKPINLNILANDSDIEQGVLSITTCELPPENGSLTVNTDGSVTYSPNTDFTGNDQFCYIICDDEIPTLCATAWVYLYIKPDILVYNGFSPNGDGNNDHMAIRGIEDFPENEVEIFNRYGDKIRKFSHYDNHNVFWDGTNNNGKQVPDGTYFYILKIKDASAIKGWVFVRGKK